MSWPSKYWRQRRRGAPHRCFKPLISPIAGSLFSLKYVYILFECWGFSIDLGGFRTIVPQFILHYSSIIIVTLDLFEKEFIQESTTYLKKYCLFKYKYLLLQFIVLMAYMAQDLSMLTASLVGAIKSSSLLMLKHTGLKPGVR